MGNFARRWTLGFAFALSCLVVPHAGTQAVPPTPWNDEGALSLQWSCTEGADESDPEIILSNARGSHVLRLSPQLKASLGEVSRLSGEWIRVEYTKDFREVRTLSVVPESFQPPSFKRLRDFKAPGRSAYSPGPNRNGVLPYITILAKFSDRPSETAPKSYYDNLIGNAFPSLGHYFSNVSNGAMSIQGSGVVNWITLPKTYAQYKTANGTANFNLILQDATAAVDAQVDFRNYYGINVCVNDDLGNSIWGMGGTIFLTRDGESRAWGATLNGPTHHQFLLAHEMGHSLGLRHFSSDSEEYGSPYCPMGNGKRTDATFGSRAIHFQMFQKWWLNWIPESRVYYGWPGTVRTVRLERRSDPAPTGYLMSRVFYGGYGSRYFTLEAVKGSPGGYDGEPTSGYVVIGDVVEGSNPKVVDAAPGSGNDTDPLYVGMTYENLARGVRFRVVSEDAAGFNVEIAVDASVPMPNIVKNTNDSGPNSLREAMLFAKQFPTLYPRFNIPPSDPNFVGGVATIKPLLSLPELNTTGVVINGLTQTVFGGDTNPNGPEVVLDGSLTGGYVSGLVLHGPRNVVRALGIQNFTASGVYVYGPEAANNVIDRCYIGTTADGMTAAGNGWDGVTVADGATSTWIGGIPPAANLISSNGTLLAVNGKQIGVKDAGTDNTLIQSNFIGGNRTGTAPLAGSGGGISVSGGPNGTRILGNRISGNPGNGIEVRDGGTDSTTLKGNRIGVSASGITALANTGAGVLVTADPVALSAPHSITIGGSTPADRNVISGNVGAGIQIEHPDTTGVSISGNWIGLSTTGTVVLGNGGDGISVTDAKQVKIGGVTANEANYVGGNILSGILITNVADVFIQGNRIGFTVNALPAGNGGEGIDVADSLRPRVGGTTNGTRNVVGNSLGAGIRFANTADGYIQGNLVGLTPDGLNAAPNGGGILLKGGAARNLVGGTVPSAVNVVGACLGSGISIIGSGSDGNRLYGNWIGFATNGTTPMQIEKEGILLNNGPANITIGGQSISYRNVIGNTLLDGVAVMKSNNNLVYGNWIGFAPGGAAAPVGASGILIGNTSTGNRILKNQVGNLAGDGLLIDDATSTTVQGNLFGFAYGGEVASPIAQRAISLVGGSGNLIGGALAGQGNLIGNANTGLGLSAASNNTIQGNSLGITRSGLPADFVADSIIIELGSSGNWIGGTTAAAGNRIRGGARGVAVSGVTSLNNRIRLNSILGSRVLGIDLVGNDGAFGVTANDALDADTGPNGLSNFPVITSVQTLASTLTVQGSLSGLPSTAYTIDLYANVSPDASAHGEGQVYLGSVGVVTNAAGQATFSVSVPRLGGLHLAATATDSSGNTSEFGPSFVRS